MDKKFFNDYFDETDPYDDEDEIDAPTSKTFTKGFITALSICLVAIGAALWTTVHNFNSYLTPKTSEESSSESHISSSVESQPSVPVLDSDVQVNADVSNAKKDKTKKVVFTSYPINNKKIINDYTESPVYDPTLKDFRAHPGIDYEAEVDDKVRAMGSGVVKNIYYDDMLGTVVMIEHSDSVQSYYCGLAKTTLVQMGEVVSAGDFVGTVYAVPGESALASHVHVAVKENGKWVNPKKFMKTVR